MAPKEEKASCKSLNGMQLMLDMGHKVIYNRTLSMTNQHTSCNAKQIDSASALVLALLVHKGYLHNIHTRLYSCISNISKVKTVLHWCLDGRIQDLFVDFGSTQPFMDFLG